MFHELDFVGCCNKGARRPMSAGNETTEVIVLSV